MADDTDAEAPPSPTTNKVEIHVGAHIVVIESADPLADVVGYALDLHQQTAAAGHEPMGFTAAAGGEFERAEPYLEPGREPEPQEDDHAR